MAARKERFSRAEILVSGCFPEILMDLKLLALNRLKYRHCCFGPVTADDGGHGLAVLCSDDAAGHGRGLHRSRRDFIAS